MIWFIIGSIPVIAFVVFTIAAMIDAGRELIYPLVAGAIVTGGLALALHGAAQMGWIS